MAKAISTADSAARLDPLLLIAKPTGPQGRGTAAQFCARTAA